MQPPKNTTLPDRFWKYVTPDSNGCWLWTGKNLSDNGYGRIKIAGKNLRVHRLSWGDRYGELPDGLFVLHTCDVRLCVNYDHLYSGTLRQNYIDRISRGENFPASNHVCVCPKCGVVPSFSPNH